MLFNWSKSREKQTRKKAFHHLGWLVIAVVPHASSWWELALTPLFWICHRNTSDIKQIRELIRLMTDWPTDIITYLFPYSLPMSGKLCFLTSLRCGSVAAWLEGIGGKGIYEKVKAKSYCCDKLKKLQFEWESRWFRFTPTCRSLGLDDFLSSPATRAFMSAKQVSILLWNGRKSFVANASWSLSPLSKILTYTKNSS